MSNLSNYLALSKTFCEGTCGKTLTFLIGFSNSSNVPGEKPQCKVIFPKHNNHYQQNVWI